MAISCYIYLHVYVYICRIYTYIIYLRVYTCLWTYHIMNYIYYIYIYTCTCIRLQVIMLSMFKKKCYFFCGKKSLNPTRLHFSQCPKETRPCHTNHGRWMPLWAEKTCQAEVFFLTNALCGWALANPPLILVIRPPQHMAGRETTQPHPDTQTTILRPLAKISKAAVKEENCC